MKFIVNKLLDIDAFTHISSIYLKRHATLGGQKLLELINNKCVMKKSNEHGKYHKMNIRLDDQFYRIIQYRALLEHLPPSTYVRKYLMDTMLKNNSISKCLTNETVDKE